MFTGIIVLLVIFIRGQTYGHSKYLPFVLNDTITNSPAIEDAAIDEIVRSKVAPSSEKIQYFNQVTRYGFKNLFKNYSYNAAMPYSSQVNPYAENYMQDYLQAHGNI